MRDCKKSAAKTKRRGDNSYITVEDEVKLMYSKVLLRVWARTNLVGPR
jgi:hypothetical protein